MLHSVGTGSKMCVSKCKNLKSTNYDNVSIEVYFHVLISFSSISSYTHIQCMHMSVCVHVCVLYVK